MTISTMIVYSIFYLVGNSAVPYVPEGSAVPQRYSSEADCKQALKEIRIDLASRMPTEGSPKMTAQEKTNFDKEYSKAQSMSCQEIKVDLPPATEKAQATHVPQNADSVVMWRIGRIDDSNTFHGTAYNEYAYDSEVDCKAAYAKTQSKVFAQAVSEGADNVKAADVLSTFNSKYSCETVALTQEQIKQESSKKVATLAPEKEAQQLPTSQEQQVPTPIGISPQSLIPVPSVIPKPYTYNSSPIYVVEMVPGIFGTMQRIVYPTPFATAAQCWQAITIMFGTVPSERRDRSTCITYNH